MSPDCTIASGPPAAASGETWRTTVPYAVPLIRPSQMRTMSRTPSCISFLGSGMFATSGIPGYPLGVPAPSVGEVLDERSAGDGHRGRVEQILDFTRLGHQRHRGGRSHRVAVTAAADHRGLRLQEVLLREGPHAHLL